MNNMHNRYEKGFQQYSLIFSLFSHPEKWLKIKNYQHFQQSFQQISGRNVRLSPEFSTVSTEHRKNYDLSYSLVTIIQKVEFSEVNILKGAEYERSKQAGFRGKVRRGIL